MKTTETNFLSVNACREAMRKFWDDQTAIERERQGVVMALPLMYPDGWQVMVHLEPLSQARAVITDKGRTLANLSQAGLNYDARAKQTYDILEERKRAFELIQDGFELKKEVHLPLDGIDIQLFAESLVSVAHLIYRYEPATVVESTADNAVRQVFKERGLTSRTNVEIDGEIEKRIRVDYLVETTKPVACQVVRRRSPLIPYMEQWGFRWRDIHDRNPRLGRAMVYDPDKQEWDETALNIGRQVCDLFCPYFETQTIHDFLDCAGRS